MTRKTAILFMIVAIFPLFAAETLPAAELVIGKPIADLTADPLVIPAGYKALGLTYSQGPVRLTDIKGEFLVLELFNRYCMSCLKQAAEIQKFYQTLREENLSEKVSVLGIGIGNSAEDLLAFKKVVPTDFPMAPDQSFDFYYSIGDLDSAPATLFLKKQEGRWLLADAHNGIHGAVEMLARIKVMLLGKQGNVSKVALHTKVKNTDLTLVEKLGFAKQALRRAGSKGEPVRLMTDSMDIFSAVGENGEPLGLFAVVSKRQPVCDLCHESVFALVTDSNGVVKAFLPIVMTKFGNEGWSAKDENYLERRIVGRNPDNLEFDGEVDAVTSATMSSSLIFDEARRAGKLIRELSKK